MNGFGSGGCQAERVECHGLQNAQDRDLLQLESIRAFIDILPLLKEGDSWSSQTKGMQQLN
jgi:hypothetical protein